MASMWQRITNPDLLIFLDASFEIATQRRNLDWRLEDYAEQHYRLRHAREHANLYLFTDPLTAEEVARIVKNFIDQYKAGQAP